MILMTSTAFPLQDAQVQCTLASIAYAGDTLNDASPSLEQLHIAINTQLNSRPDYATKTCWKLVWGPVEAKKYDNLCYAAYDVTDGTLAISIRGTTSQTWSRVEDVPFYTTPFPDPKGAARVSGPFLKGLETMLATKDQWQQKTLAEFVTAFQASAPISRVVVNGHSQGAALVPLMMLALQGGLKGAPKISQPVSGFAFAPPTTGNPDFAALVNTTCDCWFVINPKDVVPLGYDAMSDVISKDIPEPLEGFEKDLVEGLIDWINTRVDPSAWAQPTLQALLEAGTIVGEGLFAQIGAQHNNNASLAKLGAPGTDLGPPRFFAAVP